MYYEYVCIYIFSTCIRTSYILYYTHSTLNKPFLTLCNMCIPYTCSVLVRCDLNVPLDKAGAITDDTRIRGSIPTLKYLASKGAKVCLIL